MAVVVCERCDSPLPYRASSCPACGATRGRRDSNGQAPERASGTARRKPSPALEAAAAAAAAATAGTSPEPAAPLVSPVAAPVPSDASWRADLPSAAWTDDVASLDETQARLLRELATHVEDREPDADDEPPASVAARVPGSYLPPSAGGSLDPGPPPVGYQPSPAVSPWTRPVLEPAAAWSVGGRMGGLVAAPAAPVAAPRQFVPAPNAVAPWVDPAPRSASVVEAAADARAASTWVRSVVDLLTFGLVAVGGSLGIASVFLPWAAYNGMGIGTTGSHPTPSDWAWGMNATPFIIVCTLVVMIAAALGERVEERFPRVAGPVNRLFGVVLPLTLSGLYGGVGLLYMTLPFGYGYGVVFFLAGGGLIFAGGLLGLFAPSRPAN